MPSKRWKTGALAVAGVVLWGQVAPGIVLRVLEGDRLVVAANSSSARRITVEVRDAQDRPVSGATVTFRLPSSGPAGKFASGLPVESFLTGADGRASVQGIQWDSSAGPATIHVSALFNGARIQLEIPVEVSAALKPERIAQGRGGRLSKTWLIAAGVAGGALAALSAGRKGSSSPAYVAPQPVVTPPSISNPTISITRP